jgi:pimeloyl-ACP methyl ester carboxylesterase
METIPGLRHEYVQINGIRMHYAIAGDGPLVLMLHGFPDFWYTWRHQMAALADRFTVVAPDQRGYNETTKPGWGYSVDVLASDVVELIHALGHARALLVGHDWGAAVAWAVAIAQPHRVERLAVLNVPHPAVFAEHLRSNPRQMLRSSYMGFFTLPYVPEFVLSRDDYAPIRRILRRDLGNAISDAELAAHLNAVRTPGALTGGLNWYRAAAAQGPRALYAGTETRCAVPTLLMYGDSDPFLGAELFVGNERFAPDLRVRPVPGAGHWVHLKEHALVTAELRSFFGGRTTR